MSSLPPIADLDLRRASVCQLLHWVAIGRTHPQAVAEAYAEAIGRINPQLNAYVGLSPSLMQEQARTAEHRRRDGVIGRLDGIPVAIKDNLDIAGWPTRAGLPGREQPATVPAVPACQYRRTPTMMRLVRHSRSRVSA